MTDEQVRTPAQWNTGPAAKAKNAVQRSVTALLDELAPERVLTRVSQIPGEVEQHRTPSGCVLQAADCAVSVSWFPETTKVSALGELHVVVWRGKVTRRGGRPPTKGATIVADFVVTPIDPPSEDALWLAADGTRFDTVALSAKILGLLESQILSQG